LFETPEEFRSALTRAGFDGATMQFKSHTIEWHVPSGDFIFEVERNAGVRTAGLLARQTREALRAIRSSIQDAIRAYAKGDGFAVPKTAYIVTVAKA
jgi:hypothetical protein